MKSKISNAKAIDLASVSNQVRQAIGDSVLEEVGCGADEWWRAQLEQVLSVLGEDRLNRLYDLFYAANQAKTRLSFKK